MICPERDNNPYHKQPVIAQPSTVQPVYLIRSLRPPNREPVPIKTVIRQEIALPVGLLTLLFFFIGSMLGQELPSASTLPIWCCWSRP